MSQQQITIDRDNATAVADFLLKYGIHNIYINGNTVCINKKDDGSAAAVGGTNVAGGDNATPPVAAAAAEAAPAEAVPAEAAPAEAAVGGNTARGTIDGGGGTKTQGEVGFVAQQGGIIEGKVAAQAQQPTEAASPAGAATVPPAAATREQQVAMRKAAKVKEIAAKLKQRAAKQAADAAAKKQADAARVTGSTEASRAHAASAQKIQQGTAANHEQTFLPSGETVRPTGVDGAQQNVNLGGQGGGTRKKRKRKKKKKRNKTAKKKRKK